MLPPGIEPIDLDEEEDKSAPPGIEPIDLEADDPLVADAALYSSLSELLILYLQIVHSPFYTSLHKIQSRMIIWRI